MRKLARVLILRKKFKERMKMLVKLRNKGNYRHNKEVFESGAGSLKLRRVAKKKNTMPKTMCIVFTARHCTFKGICSQNEDRKK